MPDYSAKINELADWTVERFNSLCGHLPNNNIGFELRSSGDDSHPAMVVACDTSLELILVPLHECSLVIAKLDETKVLIYQGYSEGAGDVKITNIAEAVKPLIAQAAMKAGCPMSAVYRDEGDADVEQA